MRNSCNSATRKQPDWKMPMTRYFSKEGMLLLFSCQVVSDSLQPHRLQHTRLLCSSLSPSLFKFMSTESAMLSNYLILCHPLLFLPSIFPSIRIFFNESGGLIAYSFASGGQNTGASASASSITVNIQGWSTNRQAYGKMLNITMRKIQLKPQWGNTSHKKLGWLLMKRKKKQV